MQQKQKKAGANRHNPEDEVVGLGKGTLTQRTQIVD